MKYRSSLICLCIFLAGLMIVNQSFGDEAKIKDTAVGIWLFEDNADDSSGKKNHGQLKNGAKISGGGKFGNALSLDGKDDYVLVNPSASLESSAKQYTGVAWVKLDKEGVQRNACCNDDQFVVGWTPGWHNLLLVFGAGRNTNQGKVEIGSAELAPQWNSGTKQVNDDKWHHLAFAYSGDKKILYIDGKVDINQDASGAFGIKGVTLTIGGTANDQRIALGLIDDVGVFNTALSEADVNTIMNKGLPEIFGVVAVSPKDLLTTTWSKIRTER